ncbi:MAG: protein jag [Eubacterium sp.]|nr:protein jag [Eubacterium sp.]
MEWLEVEDKTVQDALTQASIKLELTSDQLEYEVIEEEKAGLLGLFSKTAKIRVRKKGDYSEEETPEVKVEPVSETTEAKPAKTGKKMSEADLDKFLKDMFDAMGLDVEVSKNYNEAEKQMEINLSGPKMGLLIGKRGQTLDALQYLISLVLNKNSEDYIKVKLDTENYRERRKETIENLAKNVAKKVKKSGRPAFLEPMNPYERRIIHSTLQDDKYVDTHSEGEEPHRKVVVTVNKEFADELKEKYGDRGGYRGGRRGGYRGGGRRR